MHREEQEPSLPCKQALPSTCKSSSRRHGLLSSKKRSLHPGALNDLLVSGLSVLFESGFPWSDCLGPVPQILARLSVLGSDTKLSLHNKRWR